MSIPHVTRQARSSRHAQVQDDHGGQHHASVDATKEGRWEPRLRIHTGEEGEGRHEVGQVCGFACVQRFVCLRKNYNVTQCYLIYNVISHVYTLGGKTMLLYC